MARSMLFWQTRFSKWMIIILFIAALLLRLPMIRSSFFLNQAMLWLSDLNKPLFALRAQQAEPYLQQAVTGHPNDNRAWWHLGLVAKELGHEEEAVYAWQQIDKSTFWLVERGHIVGQQQKDWMQAEQWFQWTKRVQPDSGLAHYWLGRAYFEQGQWVKAEEQLKTSVGLEPTSAASYMYLGLVYIRQSKFDLAEEWLLDAAYQFPDDYGIAFVLGNFYRGQGQLEAATVWLGKASDFEKNNVQALLDLAQIYLQLDEPEMSMQYLIKAELLAPNSIPVQLFLGEVRVSLKAYEEAISSLQRVVSVDTDNAHAWALLGIAFENSGDKASAEQAYIQALQISPDNPIAVEGLARLH